MQLRRSTGSTSASKSTGFSRLRSVIAIGADFADDFCFSFGESSARSMATTVRRITQGPRQKLNPMVFISEWSIYSAFSASSASSALFSSRQLKRRGRGDGAEEIIRDLDIANLKINPVNHVNPVQFVF